MRNGFTIVDADGHVHETVDGGEKLRGYMEPKFRSRPMTGGGGRTVDRHQGGKYGKYHGDPTIQLEDMDTDGIDVAMLYSTLLLGAWGIEDSEYATFLEEHTIGHTFEQMAATIQVVLGGVLERFPRLRVGFMEGMVGWIPMLAERMDEEYEHRPFEAPFLTKKPSEYIKSGRVFFGVESEEGTIPAVVDYLMSDQTLLYSSDYPHWDGNFPNTTRNLLDRADISEESKRNIIGANAQRFYGALGRVEVPA